MTRTMKAAVVRALIEPLAIEEVPVPTSRVGQILVKIAATGVCHTDLHAVDGDWPVKPKPPFIPGHEGVGHVVAVGSGVRHVKEGDRVGVPWLYSACGHCNHCLGGWETLCEEQRNTGYSVNGSFAEYVVADPDYVGRLPDGTSFVDIAPILCAGVTVYKGLKITDTKPDDWVVVSISPFNTSRPWASTSSPSTSTTPISISRGTSALRSRSPHARSHRLRQEGGRGRAGCACDRGLPQGLRASARHGRSGRNGVAQRAAAR
jgi:Alcohol dehydrogenase GroES-like domain